MAFAVGSSDSIKHDPAYVKYFVRYYKKDLTGIIFDRYIPSYDCREDDFVKFGKLDK